MERVRGVSSPIAFVPFKIYAKTSLSLVIICYSAPLPSWVIYLLDRTFVKEAEKFEP